MKVSVPSTAAPPCWPMLALSGRPLMKWKAVVLRCTCCLWEKNIGCCKAATDTDDKNNGGNGGSSSRMQQQPQAVAATLDKICNYLRAPANSFNASGGTCPTSFIALAMFRAIRITSG